MITNVAVTYLKTYAKQYPYWLIKYRIMDVSYKEEGSDERNASGRWWVNMYAFTI